MCEGPRVSGGGAVTAVAERELKAAVTHGDVAGSGGQGRCL